MVILKIYKGQQAQAVFISSFLFFFFQFASEDCSIKLPLSLKLSHHRLLLCGSNGVGCQLKSTTYPFARFNCFPKGIGRNFKL
jgi:hypothetical protein